MPLGVDRAQYLTASQTGQAPPPVELAASASYGADRSPQYLAASVNHQAPPPTPLGADRHSLLSPGATDRQGPWAPPPTELAMSTSLARVPGVDRAGPPVDTPHLVVNPPSHDGAKSLGGSTGGSGTFACASAPEAGANQQPRHAASWTGVNAQAEVQQPRQPASWAPGASHQPDTSHPWVGGNLSQPGAGAAEPDPSQQPRHAASWTGVNPQGQVQQPRQPASWAPGANPQPNQQPRPAPTTPVQPVPQASQPTHQPSQQVTQSAYEESQKPSQVYQPSQQASQSAYEQQRPSQVYQPSESSQPTQPSQQPSQAYQQSQQPSQAYQPSEQASQPTQQPSQQPS
eukprot:Hpha_TRINITY_DN15617_c0_g4::TRINITY_DN15617_c0_g4_i1::g.101606::m.101606